MRWFSWLTGGAWSLVGLLAILVLGTELATNLRPEDHTLYLEAAQERNLFRECVVPAFGAICVVAWTSPHFLWLWQSSSRRIVTWLLASQLTAGALLTGTTAYLARSLPEPAHANSLGNALLLIGLALASAALFGSSLAWLPVLLYLGANLLAGGSLDHPHSWAVLLYQEPSLVSCSVALVGLIATWLRLRWENV